MLKIRLMRIGAAKRPYYRVVAVDERKKRTGGYVELLGTYNPLTQPKEITLKQDRIDYWMKNGAVMSDGFLRIIGKGKQRLPRAPKKADKNAAAAPAEAPKSEAPAEEPVTEETSAPVEETPTEEPAVATEEASTEAAAPEEETPTPEEAPVEEPPAQEPASEAKKEPKKDKAAK